MARRKTKKALVPISLNADITFKASWSWHIYLFYLSKFFIILEEECEILISNIHCYISTIFPVIFHSITTTRECILVNLDNKNSSALVVLKLLFSDLSKALITINFIITIWQLHIMIFSRKAPLWIGDEEIQIIGLALCPMFLGKLPKGNSSPEVSYLTLDFSANNLLRNDWQTQLSTELKWINWNYLTHAILTEFNTFLYLAKVIS